MKYFASLFIFLFVVNLAVAQEEEGPTPLGPGRGRSAIYLGPVAGYNRAIHSADIASFADDPLCPFFTNGTSNGFFIGGFYEQILGGIASKHSLVGRVVFSTMPATFSKEGDAYPSLVEQGPNKVTTVITRTNHDVEVKYSLLTIEAMYKFNVVSGIVLTAGPSFDIVLQSNLKQTYKLVEPDNVRFKRNEEDLASGKIKAYLDNDRTILVYDGPVARPSVRADAKASSVRFALKFGVMYEIITGSKIDIIPGVFYNLGVTNINNVETWKVSSIQAGVDIRFTL